MNLIKVANEVYVDPEQVVSVERDTTYKYASSSPSDSTLLKDFDGSRITLKNGRKVFVRDVFPEQILEMLK